MGIKYKVNEKFFSKITNESAYILGYLYADGSLEDATYLRGKYIRVSSIDKELILIVKNSLKSEHRIVTLPATMTRQARYFLRIGNHVLYNELFKIGLRPNKSLSMIFPALSKQKLKHFIRGYFDGDGSVLIEYKNSHPRRLRTVFTSGSKPFLEQLDYILQTELRIMKPHLYESRRSYQLAYSTKDSLKLYKYMYFNSSGLYLKRKYDVFQLFLKTRKMSGKLL